ncbi:YufK family protein [Halalkalibacter alkalisediminis]|uniref:YufK family protein n=1 Tax=Halalkalibacter alkalisediminis TaxID=935616 RepID=A0ABV6NMP4_9BACI|nr:YufK family protein [Halalkalibacter alkalisediminis]
MTNRYITSHFPLISILLFSLAFAIFFQGFLLNQLVDLGIYNGMREFISESGIKLTLLFLLQLFFFMVFSALKLIADTTIELSMLFFSKDEEGNELNKVRAGSWIYLVSSILALLLAQYVLLIVILFLVASLCYFIYLVYKISNTLTTAGLIGFIFFQVIFWSVFILAVVLALVKLYNSFMASLPF